MKKLYVSVLLLGALLPGLPAAEPRSNNALPFENNGRSATFAPVVQKVGPSVVTIYSTKTVPMRRSPLFDDPFFRRFFGLEEEDAPGSQRQRQEQSLGSGVIVSADGYILSNSHVVEGAEEIRVGLARGREEYTAKVIGTDPQTDISVLKIEAKDLVPITTGDSEALRVGDVVLAVGNPFGVGQTVTMGIVSAVGRGGFGIIDYEDFIQTDASINPGNSGGALVDTEGRLVGINTAIISRTGVNLGIGFAVPINMARDVMDRIIKEGRVVRGFLGVSIQPVTPELAKEFNLPDRNGALVGGVTQNTPAARAGLREGDVITEYNGREVEDSRQLRLMVAQTRPQTRINLKVFREGKELSVPVTLEELPTEESPLTPTGTPRENMKRQALEGVEISELAGPLRAKIEAPADLRGPVVTQVERHSTAYRAGLRENDVILEVNRKRVSTVSEAMEQIDKTRDGNLLLRVWSGGTSRFLVIDTNGNK